MTISIDVTSTQTRNKFNILEEQCNRIHKNKYSYNKAIFINMRTKFTVVCPIHGDFTITPDKHTSRKQGCPVCSNKKLGDLKRKTFSWFKTKASAIHKNKYIYIKEGYKDTKTHIKIICPIHGEFMQKPEYHLQGKGCKKCGNKALTKSINLFIKEARYVHKNKYDYSLSTYVNTHVPIVIKCNDCGNIFKQSPNNHLRGCGCNSCTKHGFNQNIPAILYYLSINDGEAYKIGITNNTIEQRYNKTELAKIDILLIKEYEKGIDAYTHEQELLKKYYEYQYCGPDLLRKGNTELITKDITDEIQNHINKKSWADRDT